jgi:hypothetical protein
MWNLESFWKEEQVQAWEHLASNDAFWSKNIIMSESSSF